MRSALIASLFVLLLLAPAAPASTERSCGSFTVSGIRWKAATTIEGISCRKVRKRLKYCRVTGQQAGFWSCTRTAHKTIVRNVASTSHARMIARA
jgi:hypothetical protein